mgnify:CR=1 FL=1|jgi:hypothetical protein
MNRLGAMSGTEDKKHITFTISRNVIKELREVLINAEDYNLKKKSVWVNEAIAMLKKNPSYKDIIYNVEPNTGNFIMDKINMTFSERCLFAEIRNDVVKAYPDIEAPQSSIIRAAIFSRLFRKK